jgi:hypothetical protein
VRGDREIEVFAQAMRNELRANAHKGDWTGASLSELSFEVLYHAAKLELAIREGDKKAILEFAADVGNGAMMVADVAEALDLSLASDEPSLSIGSEFLKDQVQGWLDHLIADPADAIASALREGEAT